MIAGRKGDVVVDTDEHVRQGVTIADLQKLPPVFIQKTGTVHAGNSSGITDGASALVLMTESEQKRRGIPALAYLGAHLGHDGAGAYLKAHVWHIGGILFALFAACFGAIKFMDARRSKALLA